MYPLKDFISSGSYGSSIHRANGQHGWCSEVSSRPNLLTTIVFLFHYEQDSPNSTKVLKTCYSIMFEAHNSVLRQTIFVHENIFKSR